MARAHPFSIYLLKPTFTAENALVEDHQLVEGVGASLPAEATIWLHKPPRRRPWWWEYFQVAESLWQESKGAILFMPVGERWLALTFGPVQHNLKGSAYEYDFGLRVTLNMLDPAKLRSADMVEPGPARRRRTQVPISTDLTYLDFDADSEIIRSLTGQVKDEYEELFKNVTGAVSLKVSLKLASADLPGRCETLLALYESEDYKQSFPNIENIVRVNDPSEIEVLDAALLEAVRARGDSVTLTIPDVVDYRDNTSCVFRGDGGTSDIFPDITIEKFYEFIGDDADIAALTLDDLKTYRMILTDTEGSPSTSYSLYRSLLCDHEEAESIFHLCEGDWYSVEKTFADRLRAYIDGKCEPSTLPAYNHDVLDGGKSVYSEETYNAAVPAAIPSVICLDQTDISPGGETAIEPCDLFAVYADATSRSGQRATMFHLKISTRSSHLSHLFNQGLNAIQLIKREPKSRDKLRELVKAKLAGNSEVAYLAPFAPFDFKVVFGIITHKVANAGAGNLPLFSKLSLMRNMQWLDLMDVPSALIFIHDASPAKAGHPKYEIYLVEVVATPGGSEVRTLPGQAVAAGVVKRCPKAVRESAVGSRYQLAMRVQPDGTLSSYHEWPYTLTP